MRYSLNVAKKVSEGRSTHYCRIELGHVNEKEALVKARHIESIWNPADVAEHDYKFELTRWEEHGTTVPLYPK